MWLVEGASKFSQGYTLRGLAVLERFWWVTKPLLGGFKTVFFVKFNPYKFVLGSPCVPLPGCWERRADLAGLKWDMEVCTRTWVIAQWSSVITSDEIVRLRLCYTKHNLHRVAHEVIEGPG